MDEVQETGYTTPAEELPIVQGHRGIDGTIRVDEATLEAGHVYRVEFGGEIIGEIRVTDPTVAYKSNRIDRRRAQSIDRYKLPPHPLGGLTRKSR